MAAARIAARERIHDQFSVHAERISEVVRDLAQWSGVASSASARGIGGGRPYPDGKRQVRSRLHQDLMVRPSVSFISELSIAGNPLFARPPVQLIMSPGLTRSRAQP